MPDHDEVFGSVRCINTTFVFPESNIENPVKPVLHRPVLSRDGECIFSTEVLNVADVEPLVRFWIFLHAAPFGGHADEGAHVRPLFSWVTRLFADSTSQRRYSPRPCATASVSVCDKNSSLPAMSTS